MVGRWLVDQLPTYDSEVHGVVGELGEQFQYLMRIVVMVVQCMLADTMILIILVIIWIRQVLLYGMLLIKTVITHLTIMD